MRMRRGQVAVCLVLVLVALTVLALGNVSAFLAVRAKNHATNAGDAAALAAAHRQGELLNEIGRLNLRHAEMDRAGNYAASLEIVRRQRRLAFLGPLDCLEAAQTAARANGGIVSDEMTRILNRHVADIRKKYIPFPELYPEPWDGAWEEYAARLASIAGQGIVAGPDNIDFANLIESFPLASKAFYRLIGGASWCKLKAAGWTWLLGRNSSNMPRPDPNAAATAVNSEICSLHLALLPLPPMTEAETAAFETLLAENGAAFPPTGPLDVDRREPDDPSRCYFFYDCADEGLADREKVWRRWREIDCEGERRFPVVGRVKPVFDVLGCAVVFRVNEDIPRLLSGTSRRSSVNVAAKAFGTILVDGEDSPVTAERARGLVLPAYEAVRLVPVAAATADGAGTSTADEEWLVHIRRHVGQYLTSGVDGLPAGCSYCRALVRWEPEEYRARIAEELKALPCQSPREPGDHPGGGANPPR